MLSAIKIMCLILGILFLTIGIFGKFLSGDIIGLLLISTAIVIDRNARSHPSAAKSIANIFIVILGLFVFGVFQFVGALPNIDTTGATPPGATRMGLVVAGGVIVGGLLLLNCPKKL